ncbi:MAG: hypothetical protein WA958_04550 [Tunicatimonas sp.]
MFNKIVSTTVALCCLSLAAFAQVGITPYSTQGIGNLTRPGLVHNHSMGGIGVGTGNALNINYVNPAMLYKNTLSSFDVAFSFERTTQRRNDESATINQGGINYGVFAFPIIPNRWSASLGVMPYSTVGYRQEEDLTDGPDSRRVREGSGGLNLVSFSHGVRLYKNLAVGVRLGYLFGGINETRSIFLTGASGLTSVYEDRLYYSDVLIEPSLYFGQKVGKRTSLNLGLVYQPATQVRAIKNVEFASQIPGSRQPVPGQEIVTDSLRNVRLPQKLSFGLSLDQYLKYTVGVDVSVQAWEEFASFETGQNEGMQNSFSLAAGGQYIPNAASVNSYLARVAYRLGGHYRNLPFAVNGEQITEFGIDFGLSLPVSNLSSINLAFEVGNRGTTDQGLIRENYLRATLGVTFNDRWFIRRKFD